MVFGKSRPFLLSFSKDDKMNALFFLSMNVVIFVLYYLARGESIHEKHIFYILSGIFSIFLSGTLVFSGLNEYFLDSGSVVAESILSIVMRTNFVLLYLVIAMFLIIKAVTTFSEKEEM